VGNDRKPRINSQGTVAGLAYKADDVSYHAVIYPTGQLPLDLGTLGGSLSRANAVNAAGQVTGFAALSGDTAQHAFLWQAGANMLDVGTLGGANSQGNAINDASQIAGYADLAANQGQHAFLWQNGAMQDLGTLGGTYSEGFGINASGQVVGYSTTAGNAAQHAFRWTGVMQDLGTLGGTFSEAYGINTAGEVVGYTTRVGDSDQRAFLWKAGTMQDMNGLILPGNGWTLLEAHAINDNGEIVGLGSFNGERRAFRLKPDTTAPTITCPANVTANNQPASIGQATATDNLDPNPTISNNAPATYPVNVNTIVVWTAVDGANNKASCNQTVRVNSADTTPPVVSPQIAPAPSGQYAWHITGPVNLTWSVTDAESAITARVGCANATVTADTTGFSASCAATSSGGTSATVTANIKLDATAPTITVPAAITQNATSLSGAVVNYTAATAIDATSGVTVAGVSCAPASGSTFPLGTTTVNCSASDNAGNVGRASFAVTVVDPTPPVITPTVTGTAGANGWFVGPVTVSWAVTDAQSAVSSTSAGCATTLVSAQTAGQVISCSATSAGGTATQSVAVRLDTTAPSLTCPANVTVNQGQAINLGTPTVSDAMTPTPAISNNAPASFPLATTSIVWTARDDAGLSSTCTQQVTVNPVVSPTTTDIQLTASTSSNEARLNRSLRYTFTVRNGTAVAQNTVFADTLPSSLRFDSVTTNAGTCTTPSAGSLGGLVRCSLGNLAISQTVTITINVTPQVPTGTVVNMGQVTTDSSDPNLTNNSVTISLRARE
jgi:uncharacterized repeat protein (TIGR01451 family)